MQEGAAGLAALPDSFIFFVRTLVYVAGVLVKANWNRLEEIP